MKYIMEAAYDIPRGFSLGLCKNGVTITRKSSSGLIAEAHTVAWIEIECARINPITARIDMMRGTA